MSDSNREPSSCKPDKPYPDFPLYAHNSKRWAKKIKGKTYFFGAWRDWQAALERYQYEVHFIQAGKPIPPKDVEALTLEDLCNSFLEHRDALVQSGELSRQHWLDMKRCCEFLVEQLGRRTSVEALGPSDFQPLRTTISKKGGLVYLGNQIQRIKAVFNYAHKAELIDRPIRMGITFVRPSKSAMRKEKQSKPTKVFTADELATLYRAAKPVIRCFMLLALNGGLGNSDIGRLEFRHIHGGWIRFPRPKTSVDREFPLWAETITAIDESKQQGHESPLVFITKYGQSWYKDSCDNPITKEFAKLLKETGLTSSGRGFYALRHTFRTVADGSRDRVAIDRIMGHCDDSMGGNYREWVDPERLQAVVDHVRQWCAPMLGKVQS